MSLNVTFHKPPTTQRNATLYQHAESVIKFVEAVKDKVASYDNRDKVDLNSQPGTVVLAGPQENPRLLPLKGSLRPPSFHTLSGQLVDGKLEARLDGPQFASARVSYEDNPTETIYTVDTAPGELYQFSPGKIQVTENKRTRGIQIQQEQDFPWNFHFGPGAVEVERTFAASGPVEAADVAFFQRGQDLKETVDAEMARMEGMDNGPKDLNPTPGIIIAAGFGEANSDNLVYSHMAGDYPVPTEAALHLDRETGKVQSYTRGFGDHNVLSYRRDGDVEVYERKQFLACDRLQVQADGTRLQQHFHDVREGTLDPQMFVEETQATTRILPRIFNPETPKGWMLYAGGAGVATGTLSALFGGAGAALSVGVGLATAAITAAVAHLPAVGGIDLGWGVNRFDGSDKLAAAQTAYEHLNTGLPTGKTLLWEGEGITREQCIKSFNGLQSSDNRGLAILADKLGPKEEPAVVLVPAQFHYPLRTEQDGLVLPGEVLVPYSSVRSLSKL